MKGLCEICSKNWGFMITREFLDWPEHVLANPALDDLLPEVSVCHSPLSMLARDMDVLLVDIRRKIHEMGTYYAHSEQDAAKSLIDRTLSPLKERCDVMTEVREREGNGRVMFLWSC
jgi:cob(I)alamin adenosyltransferase